MQRLFHVYRLINILSLDTVAGAVVSALFFAKLLNVHILAYGLLALALTVWIIYTADHLRDARVIQRPASSERHRFHQQHFKLLFRLTLIAFVMDVAMIFFMRKPVLEWGIALSFAVALYLVLQRYLKFIKEIFIAALYTCGVLLPSIAVSTSRLTPLQMLLIVQFFLVALLNLLLFSWFDKDTDRSDGQHSFVTILGEPLTVKTIWSIATINFFAGIFIYHYGGSRELELIFCFMTMLLLLIFLFSRYLYQNNVYRILGDAVFLILIVYLL
jgi:hypothetical protein